MLTCNVNDIARVNRGLSADRVLINREKYGANVLSRRQQEPWWKLYLGKYEDPVIRILVIAAGVSVGIGAIEGEYAESIGIIIAIFLSTSLAFINEYRASREFELLDRVGDDERVRVIRDNSCMAISRQEVVVGDLVFIEQGEEVPADGDAIETLSLLVDQSKITGESEPVQKYGLEEANLHATVSETYSPEKLYRGTLVAQGRGVMEVTAVGDNTEIGKLATAVATVEASDNTPLNLQLEKLSQLIGIVGLSFALFIFIALLARGFFLGDYSLTAPQSYIFGLLVSSAVVALIPIWLPVLYDGWNLLGRTEKRPDFLEAKGGWGSLKPIAASSIVLLGGLGAGYLLHWLPPEGQSWLPAAVSNALLQYFMVAVTIIVVAVPEGLAMSVTLSLAYSMRKMAASNNLVRRMHACETIGAATTICSDKTGTLTQNQMRVAEVDFPGLQSRWQSDREVARGLIAEAIAANSTADLETRGEGEPAILGNATEGALLLWLHEWGLQYGTYRQHFQFTYQTSFSPEKKYMATLGYSPMLGADVIHIKGAPEVLLEYCSHSLEEVGEVPLSDRNRLLAQIEAYQKRGMRTLALAYEKLPDNLMNPDLETLRHHLTWLGFVAIADPLRAEVPSAIQACLNAGINIKVVTGDCCETALEIARQIGLWQGEGEHPYAHMTGKSFRQLNDAAAKEAVKSLKVLSRAIPLDKLRLVQLLQENGEVVAVTGDGTNDAAALKQARVGLAMGSGTAIAKEASDIILLDDSFKSIVNAIIWGRSLYKNIQRFILFQLTINVAALGIALLGPFIGVGLPLTVTQMLWVNLIMDTFAALALATEPPHEEVIEESPRNPQDFIISAAMTKSILIGGFGFLAFLVGFLKYLQRDGEIGIHELSIFFAVFVFLQFWNLFNARCLGLNRSAFEGLSQNKSFLAIAATIAIGQILIIQFGGSAFRTVPLSLVEWGAIMGGTSVVLGIGELWRWQKRARTERGE
ncbi:calcium-translocating P-type ATPase, PMCA-type [Oscillatoria sp. FACHB-1406]|uniref:calcium-translocating P-type ATPase, PMCA-type n=1 Tax=Oscillatoria sp. FACHB-1406 TaxID=2692846 RepID=UPI001688C36A|nr:calcium-translocating P-type ATPase, PMCA-type [Oscillatoria sp. FACHB-1406]MBD2576810.1 calcium-translocating P-type ATPase, PMCA-type [Oscillatoria sp. FACHB-1406]